MPRSVAIVFEQDYAASLGKLAFRTPVWLVDTPANRSAAEEAWRDAVEWPHISVTLFRAQDDWKTLLEQVELRERNIETLEVIGSAMDTATHATLVEAGFTRFDESPSGFRAKRV
ncbi:MAG TPA: hypothetical protein VE974_20935 [Thermoanaerobaculia bacterium]|nr:hypothetical protein [Thermoanaerobaculia bacterium]